MLISKMDKVIIQRTQLGICCPACGGDLELSKEEGKRSWLKWLLARWFKAKRYTCNNCQKRVRVF